ncbi:hypothetical protein [Actinophytocola xanthii]|uniref:hypothetical protein n=1 Tax=Actinophytocola xanthii TaxID=1912961 RepID=UPI001177F11A|nr:hypothetical protein [Actinophytocola xanthii]
MPLPSGCPPNASGAAFHVPGGTLSILLVRATEIQIPVAADRGRQATATTKDGWTVVVLSEPAVPGQEPPYADELGRLAGAVAARS